MNIARLAQTLRDRNRDRRGANAVEFALVAPVLFFLILTTMDFGWYFLHQLALDAAVHDSARVASFALVNAEALEVSGANWMEEGDSTWDRYGLVGAVTWETSVLASNGVWMVEVAGTIDYNSLSGWETLLPDSNISPLPDEITTTMRRRLETQGQSADAINDLNDAISAL